MILGLKTKYGMQPKYPNKKNNPVMMATCWTTYPRGSTGQAVMEAAARLARHRDLVGVSCLTACTAVDGLP